ncbi:hypothetical protein GCM10027059_38560 [Myceligenerans halotolerans]
MAETAGTAGTAGTRTVLLASAFVLLLAPVIVWFSPIRRLRNREGFSRTGR